MPPLAFLVTIPVREEDAQTVIDAFFIKDHMPQLLTKKLFWIKLVIL
jgi:hypothetical protein